MGAKDEIAAMLDSLERPTGDGGDEPPETDPPVQKPDDQPKTDAPATDPPVSDEGDQTDPPATSPPSEDDEVTKLRARVAELEAAQKPPKEAPKTSPPSTDPPIAEKDFLAGVDLDELRDDPAALNKVLNKIYAQAITDARGFVKQVSAETFETLPTKVTQQLELKQTLQTLTDNFYKENPDLGKWRKQVSVVFDETVQSNPGMKISDVLRKVGDETRDRLGLPKPASKPKDKDNPKSKDEGDPPPLPRRKGARVPNPKPAESGSVRSQIDEMNKTLGR